MNSSNDLIRSDDPFNLSRFVKAQENTYERALSEIRSGHKRSHWIWFIFPQLDGLAFSSTAKHYAIKSTQEAEAYLTHLVLGSRLLECARAALDFQGRTAKEIFGSPDDLKLRSCATLFASISSPGSVFESLLAKYYQGEGDPKTWELLNPLKQNHPKSAIVTIEKNEKIKSYHPVIKKPTRF